MGIGGQPTQIIERDAQDLGQLSCSFHGQRITTRLILGDGRMIDPDPFGQLFLSQMASHSRVSQSHPKTFFEIHRLTPCLCVTRKL